MAKGGLKPKKPRPTKEATLTDVSDLLKPEVYDRLGPIGTMNMIQTMATVAKIPEVTNLPALVDEPLLPALAGEPKAQKRVQRKVSEAETGLESPKRREILKAARDIGGSAMLPVPTSVKGTLVEEVVKPAIKAIPDTAIQAAIASFLKPKLKPVQLERVGEIDLDRDSFDPIPSVEIARHSGIPVEDIEAFLSRNELDLGSALSDVAQQMYDYKGWGEGLYEVPIMMNDMDFRSATPTALDDMMKRYVKEHPDVDLADLSEDDSDEIISAFADFLFERTHGPTLKRFATVVGDKEAQSVQKALRQRFDDAFESDQLSLSDVVLDHLDYLGSR